MIAAIAIDHLFKSAQNSSHGVAYVYCNYKDQVEQDTSGMLAAILKQLVQARPGISEPIARLHKQHAARRSRPPLDEIFETLQAVLAHYPTVHVVVDALDECRDRAQFLAKLRELQIGRDFRLMTTSRFISAIEEEFRNAPRLEIIACKEDVKQYVAGQTNRLPKCIQRDSSLQDMVQNRIMDAVDGMYTSPSLLY